MISDAYIAPVDFLKPVPVRHPKETQTPECILANLTECARLTLAAMARGETRYRDVIRTSGTFIINRRLVTVGLAFTQLNGTLIEPPRAAALRSIAMQFNKINN